MAGAPSPPGPPSGADLIMSRYRPIAPRPPPPPPLPSPASPLKPDAGDGGGCALLPPPLLPPSVERAIAAAASRWARKRRRGRVARPRRVPKTKKGLPIRKLGPQKERIWPISEIGGSAMTEAEKRAHGSSGSGQATGVLCQDAEFLARAAANAHRPHYLQSLRSGTFSFAEMMGMAMGFPAAAPVSMSNLMPLVSLDVLESENATASCNPTVSDGESRFGFPSAASPSSANRNDCNRLATQYPPAAAGELADEFQLSSTTMCAAMATALSGSSSGEKELCLKLDQSDGEDSRKLLMSLEEGSDSSHVTKIVGCTEDVEGSVGNNCIIEPVTLSLFPTSCRVASSHSAGLKHAAMERENVQNSIHWIPLKPLALNDDLHDALPGCRSLDRIASHGKPVTIAPHFHRLTRSIVKLVSITEVHMRSTPVSRHEQFKVLKQQHEGIAAPVIMTNYNTGIRVRWVNTAYKKLIGQPQCPWLMSLIAASTMRDGRKRELQSPLLAGEVSMHCCVKFPNTACAFSGLVKVEWSKYGSERGFSMALPCDVTRWVCEDDGGSALFVWKLDVEACLKLTCGG